MGHRVPPRCAQAAKRAGRVSWALKMLKLEACITVRRCSSTTPVTRKLPIQRSGTAIDEAFLEESDAVWR